MAATAAGTGITEGYRTDQIALRATFLTELHRAWPLLDPQRLDATARQWLDLVIDLIVGYRKQSATLALGYYDRFRAHEIGMDAFHAAPLLDSITPNVDAIRSSLIATGPAKIKHDTALHKPLAAVERRALVTVSGAASRHVANGGRDGIVEASNRDPRSVGYVRVTTANPCYFCAMLASRGPVYKSAESAVFVTARSERAPGEKYHDFCKCESEPLFRHSPVEDWPAQTQEYRQIWNDHAKGKRGKKALNAFRAAYESRDRITIPTQRTER